MPLPSPSICLKSFWICSSVIGSPPPGRSNTVRSSSSVMNPSPSRSNLAKASASKSSSAARSTVSALTTSVLSAVMTADVPVSPDPSRSIRSETCESRTLSTATQYASAHPALAPISQRFISGPSSRLPYGSFFERTSDARRAASLARALATALVSALLALTAVSGVSSVSGASLCCCCCLPPLPALRDFGPLADLLGFGLLCLLCTSACRWRKTRHAAVSFHASSSPASPPPFCFCSFVCTASWKAAHTVGWCEAATSCAARSASSSW